MTRGHYYSLPGVAAGIEAGLSTDALLQYLLARYVVETTDGQQSLDRFLSQLAAESLILEGTPITLSTTNAHRSPAIYSANTGNLY